MAKNVEETEINYSTMIILALFSLLHGHRKNKIAMAVEGM